MRATKYQIVILSAGLLGLQGSLPAADPAPAPAADEVAAIRVGRLWTGSEWHAPGVVLLSGGKVVVAGKDAPAPGAGRVIELPDAWATPGWVDAASTTGIAGADSEFTRESTPCVRPLRSFDPRSREARAALAVGVTTLFLEPGGDNVVGGIASVVKTAPGPSGAPLVVKEEAALKIALGSDPSSGNFAARGIPSSIYARRPTTRMGVLAILRDAWILGRMGGEDAPDADTAAMARVAAGKIPVRVLARTAEDLRMMFRVMEDFGFHPVVEDASEGWLLAKELAKAKVDCVLGPVLWPVNGSGWRGTEPALRNAAALREAGLRIALSAGGNSAGLRDQAAMAVRWGLPRDAALAAVTAEAARLSGAADRVGSLRAGMDGDVVVFDGDPLEPSSRVLLVVVDGMVVLERRTAEEAR